jgi:hypothetical protein
MQTLFRATVPSHCTSFQTLDYVIAKQCHITSTTESGSFFPDVCEIEEEQSVLNTIYLFLVTITLKRYGPTIMKGYEQSFKKLEQLHTTDFRDKSR